MWIFVIVILVLLSGILWHTLNKDSEAAVGTIILGIFGVTMCLFALLVANYEIKSDIAKFKSIIDTVAYARTNDTGAVETAAFTLKIAEQNQWLASMQYKNSTVLGVFIPDEVEELEPIK